MHLRYGQALCYSLQAMRYTTQAVLRLAAESGVTIPTVKRWLAHQRIHYGNEVLIAAAAERLGYERPAKPEEEKRE